MFEFAPKKLAMVVVIFEPFEVRRKSCRNGISPLPSVVLVVPYMAIASFSRASATALVKLVPWVRVSEGMALVPAAVVMFVMVLTPVMVCVSVSVISMEEAAMLGTFNVWEVLCASATVSVVAVVAPEVWKRSFLAVSVPSTMLVVPASRSLFFTLLAPVSVLSLPINVSVRSCTFTVLSAVSFD